MAEEVEDELDIIDIELNKLLDDFATDEDSLVLELDIISLTINHMIDDEIISEIPQENASEEEKKLWIEKSIPLIRERLSDDSSME